MNMGRRFRIASRNGRAAAIGVALLTLAGSLVVYAQATLPLPVPGSTPATPPAGTVPPAAPAGTPGAPAGAPAGDAAAKARAAAVAAKANIDVTEAWARATPGNANTADVYLHIVSAKDPDKLTGLEVAAADRAEVHDDGAGKANAVPAIDIPAGGTVNFAPGGRHVMLTGLKAPLKEGDSFLLTLKFDKAGTENTVVKILGASASGLPPISSIRRGDTTAGVSQR